MPTSNPKVKEKELYSLELLKYYRLQSKEQFSKVLGREKISACCMGTKDTVVVGTEAGMLHVLSQTGLLIRSNKAHDHPINDISVDSVGNIASCSDNGTVVVYLASEGFGGDEDKKKPIIVHLTEPVKSVCLEGSYGSQNVPQLDKYGRELSVKSYSSAPQKTDGLSFLAGARSGQLTRHYSGTSWYAQKKHVLFAGAGTAVTTIAWLGDMIAWADALQVRIMDVSSLVAICYLECPSGVDPRSSFPCTLVWASYHDLFIGWADSFRHLELMIKGDVLTNTSPRPTAGRKKAGKEAENPRDIIARTVSDWQADFLICGISPFDADHVLLLGYTPDERDDIEENEENDDDEDNELVNELAGVEIDRPTANQAEVQVCNLFTGEIVVSDMLDMRGGMITAGPRAIKLCSSYHRPEHMGSVTAWKLSAAPTVGSKSHTQKQLQTNIPPASHSRAAPPTLFVLTPEDLVCADVRDINDKIGRALQDMDMALAVNLAASDRYNLFKYKYVDLLFLYISQLLNESKWDVATHECVRLIGYGAGDGPLWERFVYAFSRKGVLHSLAPFVPTESPRLPQSIYDLILEDFLVSHPLKFATLVEKWAPCASENQQEALFDVDVLLERLLNYRSTSPWHHMAHAHLYRYRRDWTNSLTYYLDSTNVGTRVGDEASSAQLKAYDFSTVLSMIATHDLFATIHDRVWQLTRLDATRACEFLVKYREQVPIPAVVQQVRRDRSFLHLYLHQLFVSAQDSYNVQEYAEYHAMQVTLYAEFAPVFTRAAVATDTEKEETGTASSSSSSSSSSSDNVEKSEKDNASGKSAPASTAAKELKERERGTSVGTADSTFLQFLKQSNFAPLDLALKECERRVPPLYPEIIYIHTKTGSVKLAFDLLLREVGDIHAAIQFVEAHDPSLWANLTEYALTNGDVLSKVLDYSGISANINPATVVQKIPAKLAVPGLRKRLMRLNDLSAFRQFMTDQCNDILAEDTIDLQRNLNQLKRRALRVDPGGARCSACAKPIFIPTDVVETTLGLRERTNALGAVKAIKGSPRELNPQTGSIWGRPLPPAVHPSGVLVFGNKFVYHRQCYFNEKGTEKGV